MDQLSEFVRAIRTQRNDLTWNGSYPEVCALVMGFDDGLGRDRLSAGLQPFLARRIGFKQEEVFWNHVARLAVAEIPNGDVRLLGTAEQDVAIEILLDLLAEYASLSDARRAALERRWPFRVPKRRPNGNAMNFATQVPTRVKGWSMFGTFPEAAALLVGFLYGWRGKAGLNNFRAWMDRQVEVDPTIGTLLPVEDPTQRHHIQSVSSADAELLTNTLYARFRSYLDGLPTRIR